VGEGTETLCIDKSFEKYGFKGDNRTMARGINAWLREGSWVFQISLGYV
jgi:hypothetical protein